MICNQAPPCDAVFCSGGARPMSVLHAKDRVGESAMRRNISDRFHAKQLSD